MSQKINDTLERIKKKKRKKGKGWNQIILKMVDRIFCTPSTGLTTNCICKSISMTSSDYANFSYYNIAAVAYHSFVRAFFYSFFLIS